MRRRERRQPLGVFQGKTMGFVRAEHRGFVLLVALAAASAVFSFGVAAQPFVTVQLPKGVSLELPKNWVVLSKNQRITLDSSVSSRLDLSGIEHGSSDLPFAANCYDDRGNVIGIMNIRYYPDLDVTQDDARMLSPSDIEELDSTLKAELVVRVANDEQSRRGCEVGPCCALYRPRSPQ
ncbi:MAG: hypothetical protein J0L64_24740 [Acidobacteria bacterium]|nr:hypothetical protein [Acidobacteriota bacterium]